MITKLCGFYIFVFGFALSEVIGRMSLPDETIMFPVSICIISLILALITDKPTWHKG